MNAPDPLRVLAGLPSAGPALGDGGQHPGGQHPDDQHPDGLRAVLDGLTTGLPIGLVVHDAHGRVVDANPAALRLLGVSREALLRSSADEPCWQAVDVQGGPIAPDAHPVSHTLRTGEPVTDALVGVQPAVGAPRWLAVQTSLLDRGTGRPWVLASLVDITAHQHRAEAFERRGLRLQAALDGSRIATWEWNVRTGEFRCDERWARLVGYRLDELQPLSIDTWARLVHADDLPDARAQMQRHLAGRADRWDVELRMRHRGGDWRWVRARGQLASRTADARPLRLAGTCEDITERKQAEQATAHHHQLMRALFELSPLGMQLIDVARRSVVAVNDALVRVTGYSRDELIHGDGRARFPEAYRPVRDQWFVDAAMHGRFGPSEVAYVHRSGRVIHLVFNGVRVNHGPSSDFLWLSVQDVSEHRALEQQLRSAASTDRLTGLANRAAMLAELQRREASGADRFALMFLDFDRFKQVNDNLGHDAGDELLCGIAQRLREAADRAVPDGGDGAWTVARFGGDEFVVLMPGVADADAAGLAADALLADLARPHLIKQQVVHSTASIGIALSGPPIDGQAAVTADELLRGADAAMYAAKRAGRSRRAVFDAAMRDRFNRAVRIEAELGRAVALGQLQAVYQPIVDLETGAMVAVEALLRWHHPELGQVSPAEFIPMAEESRHVIELGAWVLHEACRQWAAWQREDPAAAPACVSVNVSRVQLTQGARLLDTVRDALAAAGMPPSALQLEITERDAMQDPALARQLMQALAALGVRLAMDDFGTGTSSLACLRDFPFQTIKIAGSFVTGMLRDPHVLAVAHATVQVIRNLQMASIAGGIEDPSEVATLQALGCCCGQGHLFSPPVPADRLLGAMAHPPAP